VIVGSPPEAEIGFAVAVAAVAMLRPRTVVLLDARTSRLESGSTAHVLARYGATALLQVTVGAGSIFLQGLLAVACLCASRPRSRNHGGALERVAYLYPIPGVRSSAGGGATHAREVIRAFRRAGIAVAPFTTNEAFTEDPTNGDDIRWNRAAVASRARALPASAALAGDIGLVRKAYGSARNADLIYQRHQRFALAGGLLAIMTRKPLFLEYNGRGDFMVSDPRFLAAQRRLCERAALRAAARVIVVSEIERRRLASEGIELDRIVVCPNGVDPARFSTGGGDRVRRTLKLDPSDRVIGFVGTFGPWHGARVLAEAFSLVAREEPDARLLLVGDGLERPAVERILTDRGVGGQTILAGKIPSADIPAYLDACDILASPHVPLPGGEEFFGSPTKLYEYMAAAKPIVASRLGQIGDVLEDGKTALLVTPGDVTELAAAILRLLADETLCDRIAQAARQLAAAKHTWDRRIADLVGSCHGLSRDGATRSAHPRCTPTSVAVNSHGCRLRRDVTSS
jgi:glycosyltransferase involved in cell wall biosynthesis